VAASNSADRSLQRLLEEWLKRAGSLSVALRENTSPEHDADDDYIVVYEAVLEPTSGDGACIELWECDDGRVAVGFETRERVAARLGTKDRQGGFAVGNEPLSLSHEDVLWVVESVSKGRVALIAKTLPVVGLTSIDAVVVVGDEDDTDEDRLARLGWLSAVDPDTADVRGALLYAPWTK